MNKQSEVLKWASLFLKKHDCEPKVAEILLLHHLELTRSQFFAQMHGELPNQLVTEFHNQIKQHVDTGIPVQHLIGSEMFYDRNFLINEHVLIPRPETEELVQHVIEIVKEKFAYKPITIADIGTGSGVIAVILALELPQATVWATDISSPALTVAQQNAEKHGANIQFVQGDFLQPLIDQQVDAQIIVSNPPYISFTEKSELSRTVSQFDPATALFAESNGLAAYQTITKQITETGIENGYLLFEIGHTQGRDVQAIIHSQLPHSEVSIIQDINQHDRIVTATINRQTE